MNTSMIKLLIQKDWHFNRYALLAYACLGAIALTLFGSGSTAGLYVGVVLLATVVITIGIHLVMNTVIGERKNQTLPFVMTLPISYREYTWSKVLGNMLAFIGPWSLITLLTVGIIHWSDSLPNGLVPFAVIALLELFVAFVLVMTVAIVSESETLTIIVMAIGNVCISLFWFFLARVDGIRSHMEGNDVVWNSTAMSFVGVELALIVALIAFTFFMQSRKTDFL